MNQHITLCWLWAAFCFMMILDFSEPTAHAQEQCSINQSVQGAISTGDLTQAGRIVTNGVPSSCETTKTYPGTAGTARRFDQYTFSNPSSSAICVRVTLDAPQCSAFANWVQSAAYLDSFNPANISTNYLGDSGGPALQSPVVYSFVVPANSTFVVVVNEVNTGGCASYTLTVDCQPPLASPSSVLISEFRLAGPGLVASPDDDEFDEFIELYNNTDAPIDLSGYRLENFDPDLIEPGEEGADFRKFLPGGSIVPPRGHLLVGNSLGYSLSAYAPLDADLSAQFDIGSSFVHDQGLRLTSPGGTVVYDSVGFTGGGGPGAVIEYVEGTGLPQLGIIPMVQWSWVRKVSLTTGYPMDTNNNAADFAAVSVTGETFPGSVEGLNVGPVASILGAPGPENRSSPRSTSGITPSLVDPASPSSSAPNMVRIFCASAGPALGTPPCDANTSPLGFLSIRRKFTNNTGEDVTRLRFRIVDITTLNTPVSDPPQADLRAVSSQSVEVVTVISPDPIIVQGTTLEMPPDQPKGGGLNASLAAGSVMLSSPLPGTGTTEQRSIDLQFLLGVNALGRFRFFITIEATQSSSASLNRSNGHGKLKEKKQPFIQIPQDK